MPSSPSGKHDWLTAAPYAHRGLHGPGVPENSRAALAAAIAAGFGIELDVQPSSDGEAMVFHDYELDRLTEETGRISTRSAAELGRVRLKGNGETIPTLREVLDRIGGRVPLLIEIKAKRRMPQQLCHAVLAALQDYQGQAAVMSFNPGVPAFCRKHAPELARGLVVTEEGKSGWRGRIERALSLRAAKPDFLAYDVRDLPSRFAEWAKLPILSWTVRSEDQRRTAAAHADQIIHELPQ